LLKTIIDPVELRPNGLRMILSLASWTLREAKGPHVTEVLSVDSSTATAAPRPRTKFTSATSSGRSSEVSVEGTGTVKWFNTEKGYGFIAQDSGAEDVFVHISAIERSGLMGLSEGDRVIVDIAEGQKGLEAARVRLV
jgi:CspA family cold shock protein